MTRRKKSRWRKLRERYGYPLLTTGIVGVGAALYFPQSRGWIEDTFGIDDSQLPTTQSFLQKANDQLPPGFISERVPPALRPVVNDILEVPPSTPASLNDQSGLTSPTSTGTSPTMVGSSPTSTRTRITGSTGTTPPPIPPPVSKKHPHPAHPVTPVKKGRK